MLLELLYGPSPISVARGEDDTVAVVLEELGHLGYGGGLPGAVDAHEEDDVRSTLGFLLSHKPQEVEVAVGVHR